MGGKQRIVLLALLMVFFRAGHAKPLGSANLEAALKGRADIVYFTDFQSVDWIKDWAGLGHRQNMRLVDSRGSEHLDENFSGRALEISVRKGEHYGLSGKFVFKGKLGYEPEELYARYYTYYAKDFSNQDGSEGYRGKSPGFDGTYGVEGWGGKPNSDGSKGWSCRSASSGRAAGEGVQLGFYAYEVKTGRYNYGRTLRFDKPVPLGKWVCVEQYLKLNTPGKRDGIARAWVDGELVFEKTDYLWRNTDQLKIYSYWLDYYRGGKEPANHDHHVFLDNLVIATGKRIGLYTPPTPRPRHVSEASYDFLAITNKETLSAASKRAIKRRYDQGPQWFMDFKTHDLKGDFAYQAGVTRRDPSDIITVNGRYYVYYSKATGKTFGFGTGDPDKKVFPWDKSEVWYATSEDGWTWKEQGLAVGRGPGGAFDDRSVFTPQVMMHEGKYVLVYQTVKAPYVNRVKNQVGMAIGSSPDGPFKKLKQPILSPAADGEWLGNEDSRFKVKKQGAFDSHKVHDPTLLFYMDKFYLYYKGERMGERKTFGGREIKWGVAIADRLEGPYIKSPYNPITNSGHELCVWPHADGIAALIITDGPERNTIQWSPDGINFEIKSHIKSGPPAAGLDRSVDFEIHPLEALKWGLTHRYVSYDDQYIRRFEGFMPFSP
jgi:hypothetical protein